MSKRGAQRNRAEQHRLARQERDGERHLDTMQVKALDTVSEIVERKIGKDESRQPRFTEPKSIFSSVFRWAISANEPGERATFRTWDMWYSDYAKSEPFLVSVMNAATQIDKNRGWELTGGQRQVSKYTERLHGFDDGAGWRTHIDWQAQSYYATRMGAVAEVGTEGRVGPLYTLWSVDPCRCEMTGNPEKPLRYYPMNGSAQEWDAAAFIRSKSLVSTREDQLDYGYPAVARCYNLAKIMCGVYSHYMQKLGSKTPDGILTGKFIGEEQWDEAVRARAESLKSDPNSYLNSIATIMSSGGDMPEFALTLLSSMPDRWDIDIWTKILMRGYELAFGYQGEFYPESSGVLGRGNEVQIQHRNATAQGGKDFVLAYQEKLQGVLPPTLEFQFDERDVAGEAEEAALQLAKVQVIDALSKITINGQSVLSVPQIMALAAEQGIIPDDWTPETEGVTATDEEDAPDESAPSDLSERVYRARLAFPGEPIVRYSWPSGKTRILRAAVRRSFYFPKVLELEQRRTVGQVVKQYDDVLTNFVSETLNGNSSAIDQRRAHTALIRQLAPQAYTEGLREGGIPAEEMDAADKANIANWIAEQLTFVNGFATDAQAASKDAALKPGILTRLGQWVEAMRSLGTQGMMSGQKNRMGQFILGETEEHCKTCNALHGQYHRMSWFLSRGLIPRKPGNLNFECRGFACLCNIKFSDGTFLL